MAYLLRDLLDQLTSLAGENTVFWSEREKIDAINEAISMWQLLVGQFDEEVWYLPSTGNRYYTIPRQILSPTQVDFEGVPLTLTSFPEMDYGTPQWEDQSAFPEGTPLYWLPNGVSEVAVHPVSANDSTLRVQGLAEAPFLTTPGDSFNLRDEEVVPILLYAHHYLTFKEGGAELNGTMDNVAFLVKGAVEKNDELLTTRLYRKYQGLVREESEHPVREGTSIYGVRGRSPVNVQQ